MADGKRLTLPSLNGGVWGKAWSHEASAELWHSTPVQKKNGGATLDEGQTSVLSSFKKDQWAKSSPPILTDSPSPRCSLDTEKFPVNDPSGSTIQRQRRELQLLMAELKDRDRELNAMAASHHQQLLAWERDRQKVLGLEQRCARLDDELQKRNEVIRVLTKRVWVVESREKEVQKELSEARQQLCELQQKQQHISQRCQDFEEKNQSLNSTLMALSTQVGSLQVREEELSSMLKLKDKDVTEASSRILDLTGRLRHLETSLMESRSRETELLKDSEENKQRYKEARHEVTGLKEELQLQVAQSSTQREDMIRLKQELQLLRADLVVSGEGDSWKDELLELARSKQERTMLELRCLRQVCENQRNDLQLLQMNLESARESLREKTSVGSLRRDQFMCSCLDGQPPPSVGAKTSGLVQDSSPANCLHSPVNGDLGVFSARPVGDSQYEQKCKDDDPLSRCSLQQLFDESRQVIKAGSQNSSSGQTTMTPEPLYLHKCHRPPHHQKPPADKVSETPPRPGPGLWIHSD
ncbi:coiled-coil domain-containing protein 62 isoform X2 [Mastacembelus armatus]|uniref:Coiled-coil domain containing 62 n=1 Tax=Mastacembelus armatus TaxID=205130 RepID=A0A3Q3M6F9_9TELE|nr:coiled-coil domain-containing protein 62 isoform X2 [Mastacembelus armatus]